ncbi:hypothetical protein HDU96_009008 [Phlyctochytrium bullatum]|nr:hypothetical protein HDU96_009008 [Phlyctochytrium bullatum]
MRPTAILSVLLLSTSLALAAPAVPQNSQFVLIDRRADQSVSGDVSGNVVKGNSVQGNGINVAGIDAKGDGKQAVSGLIADNKAVAGSNQQNLININGVSSNSNAEPPKLVEVHIPISAAPAAPVPPAGAAAPVAAGAPAGTVKINGDVNNTNNIKNGDVNTSNTSAGVSGNTVSGGIQKNAASTQNNAVNGGNVTLVGSTSVSNDTYNDHRNITNIDLSKHNTNITVDDRDVTYNNTTSFHNTEQKTIVNNAYYTVQQQQQAQAQAPTNIYYIQSPNGGQPIPVTYEQAVAAGAIPNKAAAAPATGSAPSYKGPGAAFKNVAAAYAAANAAAEGGALNPKSKQHLYQLLNRIKALNDEVLDLAMDLVA